jgi:uncharacterized protein YbjT (DUF2867 family)
MILVTGATGLSGSAVVREFARQGYPVKALVRSRAKAHDLEMLPGVEIVEGNMLRAETLGDALDGVERVLLISSADQQMLETQCAFIDAAKKAGVRHIVKFSGLNSALDSPFLFTRMHAEIERYLESSGLAWTHLRPSQFMQVYLREVPTIVAESAFFLPMEDAKLAPVDIEDIAKVAFALLHTEGHEGRSYDITGPQALTMTEIAEQISLAIGKTVRYVNIAQAERKRALLAAGVPPYFADALDVQGSLRRKGAEAVVHPETHEAFGVRPTIFAGFARRNAAAFRGESGPFGVAWGIAQK